MNYYDAILKAYPGITPKDFSLQDDGDGVYIKEWNYVDAPKPSLEDLSVEAKNEADLAGVLDARKKAYGTIGEQLDMIYHDGLEAWRSHISIVKANNPKPGNNS